MSDISSTGEVAHDVIPEPTPVEGAREAAVAGEPSRVRQFLRLLGPGLIAGAADDDPASIGTCASLGASLGFATLWTMPLMVPFMAAVQYMSAKIGLVTGRGLGAVLREHYPRVILFPLLAGLVVANSINAGADLGAMAAGINLLVPGLSVTAIILPLAALIVVLQIVGTYRLIERTFKWLALSLVAYIGAAFLAKPDAGTVLWHTFVPTIRFDSAFLGGLVAIIGSTFSPYLYFWQASQEVEGKVALGQRRLHQRRGTSDKELQYTAWDVNTGMIASNTVTYFVILASAATLFASGQHDVQTAEQLAVALRPVAGSAAEVLLTLGLLGTGMLAVPVLTTSAAYAVAEALGWKRGLDRKAGNAKGFYGVIVASTIIGIELNFLGVGPIRALYWTSVIYGFMAPPLLAVIILISSNRKIMGARANGRGVAALGWITVVAATLAVVGMLTLGGQ